MDINISNNSYQPYLESLEELGFSTFKVFSDLELEILKSIFDTSFGQKKIRSMYASHNSNPIQETLDVSEKIKTIVEPKLSNIFPDYKYFIGHYMVKGANTENEFSLHQDWNIVDESKFRSWQVWIPLQLTYKENGGLYVVPGSHKFFNNFRSGSFGIPVVPFTPALKQVTTSIIVPLGNILIYQNGLFHASHPNRTNQDRIAVIANFVEKIAPTYYFQYNDKTREADLYPISGDSLLQNLVSLEKGDVSHLPNPIDSLPANHVLNHAIYAEDLVNAFNIRFPNSTASQLKQLHIFKDPSIEGKLNQQGYIVLDMLDEFLVTKLKEEYINQFQNMDTAPGRFTTLQSVDVQKKNQIHEFIKTAVTPTLSTYFKDYIIPVSLFYTKKANTSGDIDIHADTTLLLNHQLEPHYAVWIPLQDTDVNNGTLKVIPRSHKISNSIFSYTAKGYHSEHIEWLRQHEIPIKLKAGQAVIFDNNLLHNSAPNATNQDRIAITFRITHQLSQYHSFLSKDGMNVEISEETHNYYMSDDWDGDTKVITGKHIGALVNGITKISQEELLEVLQKEDYVNC